MRKLIHISLLSCVLLLNSLCYSSAQVRIVKSAGSKSALDLSGFNVAGGTAVEFYNILKNDLSLSGWFTFSSPGRGEFRLLGSVKQRGSKLHVECSVYGTGSKQSLLRKVYKESASQLQVVAHRVADDIVEAITGRPGIASSRIVMVGAKNNSKDLYLCNADGGGLQQLTRDKSVCLTPQWGPNALQIVYTAFLNRFPDVFLIDLNSGVRSCLAKYPGLNTGAEFSPDGKYVALILSKDGNPDLYVKRLIDGKLTRITRTPRVAEASPAWSPDGRKIVYVSDQSGRPQLYVVSSKGGRPKRLTLRGSENVSPDWGANNQIVYASRLGGKYHICMIDPVTKKMKQLTSDYADYEDPSWAPNGRHIVCSRSQNYRSKIYILDSMGDAPVSLVNDSGDWFSPSWSPK